MSYRRMIQSAGYTVERGDCTGTNDDRADRWYIQRAEATVVDRRGPGFETLADAWAEVEYRASQENPTP